jgi:cysteine dioxygenase type I
LSTPARTPARTPASGARTPASAAPTPGSPAPTPAVSTASTASTAPTAADLLDFARRTAADRDLVRDLPLDPEGRTWVRLEGPGGAEAWLIGWPPGAETGWHDHGGSYGVFVTAAGELTEDSVAVPLPSEGWRSLELADGLDRRRILPEGEGRAFGRNHVHHVVNRSETSHAVSVHAYYPPLPLIRRYSRKGGTLRLELVERPEEW